MNLIARQEKLKKENKDLLHINRVRNQLNMLRNLSPSDLLSEIKEIEDQLDYVKSFLFKEQKLKDQQNDEIRYLEEVLSKIKKISKKG